MEELKEKIFTIFKPYKKIKQLEEEIENQDKQFGQQQTRFSKMKTVVEELTLENKMLEESNEKYLSKIKDKTLEIKKLKSTIKELEEREGKKSERTKSKRNSKKI